MKPFRISILPAWCIIFITAVISALIGIVSLVLVWELMQKLSTINTATDTYRNIAFTIGLPIILEVFSIVVVTRMALLGRFFPDERREWWGRIGGIIHRAAFIWFIIAGSSLLGYKLLQHVFDNSWAKVATFGSWTAIVGSAVKAAFNSKTSNGETKGFLPTLLNILATAGPYLFILGLIIFFPALLQYQYSVKKQFWDTNVFNNPNSLSIIFCMCLITALLTYGFSKLVGVNEFSMHYFYRNRLIRAYLGATRRRMEREKTSNPFTGFDMGDDIKLSELTNQKGYYGPYPILNTALNATQVTDLDRQDRKAESFVFTPLFCGFDFSRTVASANLKKKSHDYGFRPTEEYTGGKGPSLGTAMAISGAALNPNQGYHSSPATAFLLTIFNAAFGWWTSNPRNSKWQRAEPRSGLAYIIYNLMGQSNTTKDFVCLSDGGHFDNMGLYELVRRRCSYIILGDSEQDNNFSCEGLANAIRRCRIDFGAEITIDIEGLTKRNEHNLSIMNYTLGYIKYAGEEKPSGTLLYIKASITGKEPVDVREYSLKHLTFPDQSTADQFFNEEQFESYRKLGLHIGDMAMSEPKIISALEIEPFKKKSKFLGRFLKLLVG